MLKSLWLDCPAELELYSHNILLDYFVRLTDRDENDKAEHVVDDIKLASNIKKCYTISRTQFKEHYEILFSSCGGSCDIDCKPVPRDAPLAESRQKNHLKINYHYPEEVCEEDEEDETLADKSSSSESTSESRGSESDTDSTDGQE